MLLYTALLCNWWTGTKKAFWTCRPTRFRSSLTTLLDSDNKIKSLRVSSVIISVRRRSWRLDGALVTTMASEFRSSLNIYGPY